MAIRPKVRESNDFLEGFKSAFSRTLGIKDFSADSKYRVLVEPVISAMSEVTQANQALFNSRLVSSATGRELDDIAFEVLGSGRIAASAASASRQSMNVAFYVTSGTFGDLFSGSYTIPAGTKIYSDKNQNEQNLSLDFYTTEDLVLDPASSASFVSVKASLAGRLFNVGAHVLKKHGVALTGLKVTNFYPILNGRDREEDEQLRFRISRYSSSLIARNSDSVLANSIEIPGVISTRSISGYYGPGTCGVIVLCTDYEANSDIIRSVQTRIDTNRTPGLQIIATPAVKNSISIAATLEIRATATAQEKSEFEARMLQEVKAIFRNAGLNGIIARQDIEDAIKRTSSKILSKPSSSKKRITELYTSRNTGSPIEYYYSSENTSEHIYLSEDEYADANYIFINYVEVA